MIKLPPRSFEIKKINMFHSLHIAAFNNDYDAVINALSNGVDVNLTDENTTALHIAAEMGHTELIKILVQHGADFSLLNSNGMSPLHLAVAFGKLDAVVTLLLLGADVNIRNTNNETPLYTALIFHHNSIAKQLIKMGAKQKFISLAEQSALHIAIINNDLELVKWLIANHADLEAVNCLKMLPLHTAIAFERIEIAKCLIDTRIKLRAVIKLKDKPLFPFELAARKGTAEIMYSLVEKNAGQFHHGRNIKFIKQQSISNPNFYTMLAFWGIKHGYTQLVISLVLKRLIDAKSANRKGETLLHFAVMYNDFTLVEYLLSHAPSLINSLNDDGMTPLNLAVKLEHIDIVNLLLELGALNLPNRNGENVFHLAAVIPNVEFTKLLLDKFDNIDLKVRMNRYEHSLPLEIAIGFGNWEVAKLLAYASDVYNETKYSDFLNGLSTHSLSTCNVEHYDGLAMLSYLYEIKEIQTPSTMIDEEDLYAYLFLLKCKGNALVERFIITGELWRAGEIRILENGDTYVLLLNSMIDSRTAKFDPRTQKDIDVLFKVFCDVKITVYLPSRCIQDDLKLSKFYALDAWRKLDKIGEYLPKEYNTDIFEYLDNSSKRPSADIIKKRGESFVFTCNMPLYFMKYYQESETSLPIKSYQTPYQSSIEANASITYQRNMHIIRKAQKFREKTTKFIKQNALHTLLPLISKHTLKAK